MTVFGTPHVFQYFYLNHSNVSTTLPIFSHLRSTPCASSACCIGKTEWIFVISLPEVKCGHNFVCNALRISAFSCDVRLRRVLPINRIRFLQTVSRLMVVSAPPIVAIMIHLPPKTMFLKHSPISLPPMQSRATVGGLASMTGRTSSAR